MEKKIIGFSLNFDWLSSVVEVDDIENLENVRKSTNLPLPGLRIRPNRSPSNFLSIGTPPRLQNPTKK